MRVHIIDGARKVTSRVERDRFAVLRGHWFPVALAADRLAEMGIEVAFFETFSERSLDCDAVVVASRHFDQQFETDENPLRRAEAAESLARRARLIWFDLRDSSGTPQFEVLPHVERYVKQALLTDLRRYGEPMYGGRIFTDYAYRTLGVRDEDLRTENQEDAFTLLDHSHAGKLRLGWNASYGVRGLFASTRSEQAWIDAVAGTGMAPPPIETGDVHAERRFAVAAMMSGTKYVRETIAHQRRVALAMLQSLGRDDVLTAPLPYDAYSVSLRQSQIALSCFGNGEICYRECEAWIAGCAVLMPEMSHVRTYPPLYRPFETYLPLRWDLADLSESIARLEGDPALRLAIARNGQAQRVAMFSREGLDDFAMTFRNIVLC